MKHIVLIQKPTIIHFLFGMLVTLFFRKVFKQDTTIPKKIGSYLLMKEIKNKDGGDSISTGIYTKNRKKYFIKTWQGNIKDIYYYYLVNEYCNTQYLKEKLVMDKKQTNIDIPTVIVFQKSRKMTNLPFELLSTIK